MRHLFRSKLFHINPSKSMTGFDFQVKDFGPIREADISIKPLTILIGSNRSGKSQLAMLTHALISSYSKLNYPTGKLHERSFFDIYKKFQSKIDKYASDKKDKIVITSSEMHKIKKIYLDRLFKDVFPQELQYYFSANFDQLTRFGAKSFALKFRRLQDFSTNQQKDKVTVKIFPTRKINLVCKSKESSSSSNENTDKNDNGTYEIITNIKPESPYATLFQFQEIIKAEISRGVPRTSYYFPAARSGILQAHRTVAAGMIRNAGRTVMSGIQAPQISGTVTDFVSDMIGIESFRGNYYKLGENLEREMLDGYIILSKSITSIPEIEYKAGIHKIPIHRTSSSISDIAPLTLFLKHVVEQGDLLIIEEPEAHLDHADQLVFARYLVKMVRAGINVMITTHSALMLEQLSNFLQVNKIDKTTKTKLKFDDDEYLTENEIAPYLLTGSPNNGYKSHLIEFSEKDGISQDEFVKIQNELTKQTWHIETGMLKEK